MSNAWITVILAPTCCILTCSNIVYLDAVAQDLFAFARDRGFSFSSCLAAVHPSKHVPVNATIVTSITSGWSGSDPTVLQSFYRVLALAEDRAAGNAPASCLLARKVEYTDQRRSSGLFRGAFFWSFWPQEYPVTPTGFNWAAAVFGVVLIGEMFYFVVKERKQYFGPVVEVEGRTIPAWRE